MSLLDKMKAAAQDAASVAKKGAAAAKDKAEDVMLRRKADEAARQIGWLIHKERTGGPEAGAEIDRLVEEITSLEAQIAEEPATEEPANDETSPATSAETLPPQTSAPEPTAGDMNLG
jgi:hypothetical protein